MRIVTSKTLLATALIVASTTMLTAPDTVRADAPRVVEITAKRFAFTPNQIELKKGEPVILRLTSEDVVHGFFIREFKLDEDIEPGHPNDFKITPMNAGSFSTICDHFCGANHGAMNMTIVVR